MYYGLGTYGSSASVVSTVLNTCFIERVVHKFSSLVKSAFINLSQVRPTLMILINSNSIICYSHMIKLDFNPSETFVYNDLSLKGMLFPS